MNTAFAFSLLEQFWNNCEVCLTKKGVVGVSVVFAVVSNGQKLPRQTSTERLPRLSSSLTFFQGRYSALRCVKWWVLVPWKTALRFQSMIELIALQLLDSVVEIKARENREVTANKLQWILYWADLILSPHSLLSVERLDNAIHRINRYPVDKCWDSETNHATHWIVIW